MNMYDMSATFEVSKLDRSSSVSDEHVLNIEYMLVALLVTKRETSRDLSDEQP